MVIIIPARLASSRLPNKVLLELGSLPMCVRTAKLASKCARAIIAADSEQVMQAAAKYDIECILTSTQHQSGSERLEQAARLLNLADDELVINLQADEPFFGERNLARFCEFAAAKKGSYFMASAFYYAQDAGNFNRVKVVCDQFDYAMYFSRSAIPFCRGERAPYRHHLGIYAYEVAALKEFITLKSSLERIEQLEQLRALENGKRILMCELESSVGFGIDSPQDYEKACALLAQNPNL